MNNIFRYTAVTGAVAFVLAACATSRTDLPTVSDVDLERYAGTWYEQARLPNKFQDDCVGDVKAEYTLRAMNTIRVVNQCRTEDGSIKTAEAVGRLSRKVTPRDPARLQVRFAPDWLAWASAAWGDYWIMRVEGDYEYSLVGTPDRKYLWVLSRQQQADPMVVQRLLDYAETQGFDTDQVLATR